jgi:hypothetical protein
MRSLKEWWNDEEREAEFWDYASAAVVFAIGFSIGLMF